MAITDIKLVNVDAAAASKGVIALTAFESIAAALAFHLVSASPAYQRLVARLNRFPQGAPPSERLYQILRLLFTEEEASRRRQEPVRAAQALASGRWRHERRRRDRARS